MPTIFVDTEHSTTNKLYIASKAGSSAIEAVKVMRSAVKTVVDGAAGFTTIKTNSSKGYQLSLTVIKVDVSKGKTTCQLSYLIARYPPTENKEGKTGVEMVASGNSGVATVDGTTKADLLSGIEALATSLATKSLPAMTKDAANR